MKLKFVKFLCYIWDVTFTIIDICQLKIWYHLVKWKENLEEASRQDKRDFSNLEDWNDWEDVQ